MNEYRSGKSKATIQNGLMNDFKGKSAAIYFDIASILNALNTTTANTDTAANKIMPAARQTFSNVKGYVTNFNGKFTEANFALNLQNEKENSLTSLAKFVTTVAEVAYKNRDTAMKEERLMAPPPTAVRP
jgi:hypothetical protein